jgi:hypothetical protein
MEWIRNNTWILLLAGAITTAVALATPAAMGYFTLSTLYIWLWALNIRTTGSIWFNTDDIAVAGAILETGVLVVAIALLFLLAIKVKGGTPVKGMYGIMLACLIMLVASPVGYIIGAVGYDPFFWTDHVAGFGIYGSFIAAGLVIVSFLVLKKK